MLAEAVSPASAALPELAHLHLLAHLAGVPTEASLSYIVALPTDDLVDRVEELEL